MQSYATVFASGQVIAMWTCTDEKILGGFQTRVLEDSYALH